FNQASGFGGKQAAVTGDNPVFRIDEDRIGEPELRNRGFDLLDLAFGMGAGIAGVGDQLADGPVGETEIVRFLLSTHYSLRDLKDILISDNTRIVSDFPVLFQS